MSITPTLFRHFSSEAIAAPVQQAERIVIIDSIRGFALLGILLMNIPYFADSYYSSFNLTVHDEFSGRNYYTWWVVNGLFEGTMRALFSMLFGAGSILLVSRLEKRQMTITPADFYYRRMIWLLIFGVINAFIFLWAGDILYSYALCGLFLYPLRNLKPKHLLMLGFAIMLVSSLKSTLHMYDNRGTRVKGEKALALEKQKVKLTEEQESDKKAWATYQEKHTKESLLKEVQKERKEYSKGYFALMAFVKTINVKLEGSDFYDSGFWDVLAFLLLGMAFFKWGWFTAERSKGFYWALMLIGYITGTAISYFVLSTAVELKFDDTKYADKLWVSLYQERRLLQALGHASLLTLLYKYNVLSFLLRWLSRVGQMAFTNYLMQSIICAIIFYGFGFGLFGKLQRFQWYYVVAAVWVFQIIFSNIWLRYFLFGPFEWLWRSLTYWKKQPILRDQGERRVKEEQPVIG